VLGEGDFLGRRERPLAELLGQLAMLVVTPAKDSAVLNAARAHLINFALKLGTLVLIGDTQGVPHEIVVCGGKLGASDAAILDDSHAEVESDLAHPVLEAARVPLFDAWPHLFLQGEEVAQG